MTNVQLFAFLLFAVSVPLLAFAGGKAKLFLELNNKSGTYEMNQGVLDEISKLAGPIHVIAVLGDARVGKSTTLNIITRVWTGLSRGHLEIQEIFETGDSHAPVTRGVWAHITRVKSEGINVILLDVEGTDLGDDSQIDNFSMFTTLLSSGLAMFANNIVGNKNLHFLYRVSRLSDLVFPNMPHDNFPKLRIVIRSQLEEPDIDYIRRSIADPLFDKTMQEERKVIAKRFPKETIQVNKIPFVDADTLKNFEKLRKSDCWDAMKKLSMGFQGFPAKKTLNGGSISGRELAELASETVKRIKNNSWDDFGNFYSMFEKTICRRNYEDIVQPVLELPAEDIENCMDETLEKFETVCSLKSEISAAKKKMKNIYKRKRQEEEERKKREEGERENNFYRKKFENEDSDGFSWVDTAVGFAGGIAAMFIFSDEQLKTNITTLPCSEYNVIRLRGVSWVWNKNAMKYYGLSGRESGVIAQEVQKLYPWTVMQGQDGYLRVNYAMLHAMIKGL